MRSSLESESFVGEFGRDERQIVDAVVDGDAVEVSHTESRRHAAIVALPRGRREKIEILRRSSRPTACGTF